MLGEASKQLGVSPTEEEVSAYMRAEAEKDAVLKFAKGSDAEATAAEAKLPKSGWIVEIRGSTYNWGGETFIEKTIVESP